MKRITLLFVLIAIAIANVSAANGDRFTAKAKLVQDGTETEIDMRFEVTDEANKECEVLGKYEGGGYVKAIDEDKSGELTVPAQADGYKVVGVQSFAFYNLWNLVGITFEEGIRYIDGVACYNSSLTYCVLPSTLEWMEHPFYQCLLLESVTINSVEPPTVDQYGFDGVTSGATLMVPDAAKYMVEPWTNWFSTDNIKSTNPHYDLWVNGEQVTDANKDNLANGTVTFDGDHTLTLNNATIDVAKGMDGGIVSKMHDLTIHLEGENTFNCQSSAIQMTCETTFQEKGLGQLTIEGPGSLTINSNEENNISGIGLLYSHCTFKNCGDVKITGTVCISGFGAFLNALFGSADADTETLTVENTNLCMYSYDEQTVVLKSVNYVDTELRLPREGFFTFPFFWVMEGEEKVSPSTVVISKTGKGLAIDEVDVPDDNFRSSLSEKKEADFDFMTDNELAAIRELWLSNKGIASLKGIEHFTALEELTVSKNQLTEIDLSQLTNLKMLDVAENQLTELLLPEQPRLRHLNCFDNQLTSLDVSSCQEIEWIYCYNNQISGEETDKLVASLPDYTDKSGALGFYSQTGNKEKNVITTRQVVAANDKNWVVQYVWNQGFGNYPGQPIEGFDIYDFFIGRRRLTSDNYTDLNALFATEGYKVEEGTVRYVPQTDDEEAQTLVLDNATITPADAEQTNEIGIGSTYTDININVVGTNTLQSVILETRNSYMIFSGDGHLNMNDMSGIGYYGSEYQSLNVYGPQVNIQRYRGNAVYSESPLTFNIVKGKLTLNNESGSDPVVYGESELSLWGNTTIAQPDGAVLGMYTDGYRDWWSVLLDGSPVCGQTVCFTDGSTPTGILDISSSPNTLHPTPIYDLQGRSINGLPSRGIYIIGTRKVVLK